MSIAPTRYRTISPLDVEDGVHYPSSDGKPMGETGWHVISTLTLYGMLREFLADREAYVAANMFLYYERGNPKANRSPDCMVIFGVPRQPERRSFKVWKEGAVPTVIFEFAFEGTVNEDRTVKRELYARLGVREYFLYDPTDECRDPRLQGMRLRADGVYEDLTLDAGGGLTSEVLGLRFVPDGLLLRPIDLRTGLPLPTWEEESRRATEETRRATEEARKAEAERLRADEIARVADEIARVAEAERLRADTLAAEVERLKKLMNERGA